jgi:hypothetical protein
MTFFAEAAEEIGQIVITAIVQSSKVQLSFLRKFCVIPDILHSSQLKIPDVISY